MVVYEIINKINGKRYIGKDKNNDPRYFGSGKLIKRAVEKYGKDNFIKTILEECNSEEHLDERERYWIEKSDAIRSKAYYNLKGGGDGGDSWYQRRDSIEYDNFRDKMKTIRATKPNLPHSEKTKQLQAKKAIGRYTLDWYIDRYGDTIGRDMYQQRNTNLTYRYISESEINKLKSITRDNLLELINQGYNASEIERHYDITCKRLRTILTKEFGDVNVNRIKRMIT